MYIVYPWAAFVGGVVHQPASSPCLRRQRPAVRGINLHQHDYAQQFYPSIAVNTEALRHGQLPIWFPATLAGVPNLNVGITEYTHPMRLLLYLTLAPLFQTQAWIFLSVAFSFLGVFVLMRSIGLHPMAAALAGTVWSLNGIFVFWGLFETASGSQRDGAVDTLCIAPRHHSAAVPGSDHRRRIMGTAAP